jgi:hypothetical protein
MTGGGFRSGAGRPLGSKDGYPRRRAGVRRAPEKAASPSSDTGVDPFAHAGPPEKPEELFDPRRTLIEIASDPRQAGMNRVKACEILMRARGELKSGEPARPEVDRISARAVELLAGIGRAVH